MVQYQCKKCFRYFGNKTDFDRHLARKTPCDQDVNIYTEPKNLKCKVCDKNFHRKDKFNEHNKKHHPINLNNNKNDNMVNNIGDHNNNSVNIVNIKNYNNYIPFPFGKDGIGCLTTPEKIAIFSSDENPLEMILIKINLDPHKINHHNVGIPDLQSGYGIIFDGNKWITERINVIMEVLLNSKEKDLMDIYNEIKGFLSADANDNIKTTLGGINHTINPINKINVNAKKNLIAHLKKHLYNNRHLALEAKKRTNNLLMNSLNKNQKNILKDGVTIDDLDNYIKNKKIIDSRMNTNKKIAMYLLEKILDLNDVNSYNYKLINDKIEESTNLDELFIIINFLTRSLCYGNKINIKMINSQISNKTNTNSNKIENYFDILKIY